MDYTGYKKSSKISQECQEGLLVVALCSLVLIPVFIYGIVFNGLSF